MSVRLSGVETAAVLAEEKRQEDERRRAMDFSASIVNGRDLKAWERAAAFADDDAPRDQARCHLPPAFALTAAARRFIMFAIVGVYSVARRKIVWMELDPGIAIFVGDQHSRAPSMTDRPLQKEIETYNAKLPELLGSIGRFVLIKGDQVEGIYDTYADALKVGYERFKLEPFLVKQIAPAEQAHYFTRELDLECPT